MSISRRGTSAIAWGVTGTGLKLVIQIGTQVALARLLGPAVYGLFAVGTIVVTLANFLSDVGLAYSLIQKAEVSDDDIRFVVTWQVLLGLTVTGIVYFAAGRIAMFFGEPGAASPMQALSTLCIVNALNAPSLNLLKREMHQKTIHLTQASSHFLGYVVVGIPLALMGWGVWSLVIAWIVQAAANLVTLYARVRHPVMPLLWYPGAGATWRYGGTVLITNLVNWAIGNLDRTIVARAFTTVNTGLYSTFLSLLGTPTSALLGVVQPVLFSACAKASGDLSNLRRAFLSALSGIAISVLPVFVGVAAVSDTVVLAIYGPSWQGGAELFRPFALAMPCFLMWGITTPLLWNAGRLDTEFKLQIPVAVTWGVVCLLAVPFGVVAVAWTVAALFLLRLVVMLVAVSRVLNLEAADLLRALRGGVAMSIVVAVVLGALDAGLREVDVPVGLRFLADAMAGGITYGALIAWCPGLLGTHLMSLLVKIEGSVPTMLRPMIRALNLRATRP